MIFDVCIIGGGAAGLMAAIFASQAKARVIICEKNTTVGRKLLKTARGRCNLTHLGGVDDFVREYGTAAGRFLKHSLHTFSPEDVRGFFEQKGLATKVEKDSLVFPITDRASDVLRVLVDSARRQDVVFCYGKEVRDIDKTSSGFTVVADAQSIQAATVVIATGGLSWSFTGCTGDGYRFADKFGHKIVPLRPALVPLVVEQDWPKKIQGVGIPDVVITAAVKGKKIKVPGAMMFTEDGIGGPAVLDASRLLVDVLAEGSAEIHVDFMPDVNEKDLETMLIQKCTEAGKKELARALTEIYPRSFALNLCQRLDPKLPILASALTKEKRKQLIEMIKRQRLTVISSRPLEEATITHGGLALAQVDPKTMQSKKCEGLFFAGEVLDVDGPCGGYNLQIAWSTGALAGKNAAEFAAGKT